MRVSVYVCNHIITYSVYTCQHALTLDAEALMKYNEVNNIYHACGREVPMKRILKMLAENLIYALLMAFMSWTLGLFELPDSRVVMPAFWAQMARNYIISYFIITAVRLLAPYVKRIPHKWNRKTAERYGKLFIVLYYAGTLLLAYFLIKGADGAMTIIF